MPANHGVLDRSKVPPDLWVRMVWAANEGQEDRAGPSIALITERRRWTIGAIPAFVGFVVAIGLLIAHAPLPLVALGVLISVAGAYYAKGGKSGYYEVAEDGSLGDYLGTRVPELSWMRRVKSSLTHP